MDYRVLHTQLLAAKASIEASILAVEAAMQEEIKAAQPPADPNTCPNCGVQMKRHDFGRHCGNCGLVEEGKRGT